MDPISLALMLASRFAPELIKHFTNSETAGAVATQVIEIAKQVTGMGTGDAALETLNKDPALALQFKTAVMANETELEKAYLGDLADARKRDVAFTVAGTRNYRADFMFGLAVLVIVGLVFLIWRNQDLNEFTKGVVTLVLGRFLGYLDAIYNFEYSSTVSSRVKDATINNLSNKP